MFVFDLETCKDQKFAEAYTAGLYVVNRLRDKGNRDLTPDEIVTKKDNITFLDDGSNENSVMDMLKYISENY